MLNEYFADYMTVVPFLAAGWGLVAGASAVIADYGASDRAVAEVLFGIAAPEGSLPFELPSSMEAVRKQYADVPGDSENPLFETGFGLRYE